MARSRRTLLIALLPIGITVAAIALLIFGLGYAFGAFHDNVAKDKLATLTKSLDALGGHQICGEGDAGFGPDNTDPWEHVWYQIPNDSAARPVLFSAAAENGYPLAPMSDKYINGEHRNSYFFTSTVGEPTEEGMVVVVYRHQSFKLDCAAKASKAVGGGAIFEIDLVLPSQTRR